MSFWRTVLAVVTGLCIFAAVAGVATLAAIQLLTSDARTTVKSGFDPYSVFDEYAQCRARSDSGCRAILEPLIPAAAIADTDACVSQHSSTCKKDFVDYVHRERGQE